MAGVDNNGHAELLRSRQSALLLLEPQKSSTPRRKHIVTQVTRSELASDGDRPIAGNAACTMDQSDVEKTNMPCPTTERPQPTVEVAVVVDSFSILETITIRPSVLLQR